MKILNIGTVYSFNRVRQNQKENSTNPFMFRNNLSGDVVSFTAKKYDADSIVNPTNHCAYCGCKVYSEAQIEAIAKSMLSSKSHRLQGDIKSVLEKLDSAVRSEELTFAKKMQNKDEIDFFKKFLQISTDKSFLKGDAIFEQVYSLSEEDALQLLKRNMRPLTKTIDHVSPQNLEEENNNSDINLVEACYCCNHDLKKGVTFAEFYAMFPSIKENMPAEKFEYAHSRLISSSASSIINRMSATTLLRHIQSLFGQREQALTRLGSIDFRIVEANASIDKSIQTCNDEISAKELEIASLQAKLDDLTNDDEYNALAKRIQLSQKKVQEETVLQSLRDRRKSASDSLNELRNPPKKNKKQPKIQMTKEEKEQKIQQLKDNISLLSGEIDKKQEQIDDIELEIMELDSQFPTVEMLQILKSKADNLVTAHNQLAREQVNLRQYQKNLDFFENFLKQLNEEITHYSDVPFDIAKYSQEQQADFQRYTQLLEAQKYIEAHSTGGGMKSIINLAAKNNIDSEVEQLAQTQIVIDSNSWQKRKEVQSQIDATTKQRDDVRNQINASQKQIAQLTKTTAEKTLAQAQAESVEYANNIRILNEKQNYLKLPQTIASLKAEIILLQQTISDLAAKKEEITSLNKA